MTKIGFIGLGRMGRPMAGNMQKKGLSLLAYDIVGGPVQELVALGFSMTNRAPISSSVKSIIVLQIPVLDHL